MLEPGQIIHFIFFNANFISCVCEQQLAEEFVNRNELQMQLDSKESDIEQLREKLNDLQQRMDNSSITSLQTDETDSNIAGSAVTQFYPLNSTRTWTIAF